MQNGSGFLSIVPGGGDVLISAARNYWHPSFDTARLLIDKGQPRLKVRFMDEVMSLVEVRT